MEKSGETNQVSNARRVLDLRAGYTVKASAAAIAFLWTNWDVFYALEGGTVRMERTGDQSWRGEGYGGTGEWYLSEAAYDSFGGRLAFYNWVRFKGIIVRGLSVFEYQRLKDGRVSYWGHAWGELPPLLGWLKPMLESRVTHAMARMNVAGGRAAERITQEPDLVQQIAGESAAKIWREMQEDEAAQLNGKSDGFRRFRPANDFPTEEQRIRLMMSEIRLVAPSLENVPGLSISEYEKAIRVYEVDPGMGAAKLRSILEQIVLMLFRNTFSRDPDREETLMKQLDLLSRSIPRNIVESMRFVVRLGNKWLHRPGGSNPSEIDYYEFRTGIDSLLIATNWYVRGMR